jgi:hypothetical protein
MLTVSILGLTALVVGFILMALSTRPNGLGHGEYGMCAPARYEPLTRNPADHIAPMERYRAPQQARPLVVPWQMEELDEDDLDGWGDEETEAMPAPVVVPDWPRRVVVEPEPVPLIVDHTAARFAALEIGGHHAR